ncbi:hypothetical protein C8R43DRAFT_1235257 [Mycena crocata]|nr:hypothetical protein C8R43DRAFT_1235257 [Mycena crocata]
MITARVSFLRSSLLLLSMEFTSARGRAQKGLGNEATVNATQVHVLSSYCTATPNTFRYLHRCPSDSVSYPTSAMAGLRIRYTSRYFTSHPVYCPPPHAKGESDAADSDPGARATVELCAHPRSAAGAESNSGLHPCHAVRSSVPTSTLFDHRAAHATHQLLPPSAVGTQFLCLNWRGFGIKQQAAGVASPASQISGPVYYAFHPSLSPRCISYCDDADVDSPSRTDCWF